MEGHQAPPGYTISRRLGSDASAMCLAVDDATGQAVTLRFIDGADQAMRTRLITMAPALRAVDHLHVLPFHDLIEGPAGLVVVLGGATGGSLAGVVGSRGILPPGEVVTACAPVADALNELHQRGLFHGDLTLDDLVFDLDGRPMVAGIGLVQAGVGLRVGQHTRPLPPEVQAGVPLGPPADVYGLVTAAMAALTGFLPTGRISLPGVAPAVEAILVSALDPYPQRRPSAANVGNAFFAVADPVPVELILDEAQATTGSMPPVSDSDVGRSAADDVAAYMRRSTSAGRRARRRAESGSTAEEQSPPPNAAAGEGPAEKPTPPRRARRSADTSGNGASAAEPSAPRRLRRSAAGSSEGGGGESPAPRAGRRAADSTVPRRARRSVSESSSGMAAALADRVGLSGRRIGKVDGIWVVSAVVGALLVVCLIIVGMQVFGDDRPPAAADLRSGPTGTETSTDICGGPQPAPTAAPPTVADWTQEVERLYTLRATAYRELDTALLCQVFAPTSPALAEDVRLIQTYADSGVHPDGLSFEVITAELLAQSGGQVQVEITDRITPYQLVDDDSGDVVQEEEGTDDSTPWTAELVAVADENGVPTWRLG